MGVKWYLNGATRLDLKIGGIGVIPSYVYAVFLLNLDIYTRKEFGKIYIKLLIIVV